MKKGSHATSHLLLSISIKANLGETMKDFLFTLVFLSADGVDIRLGSNHNHVHRYIRLRVEKTMNNEYDSSNVFHFCFSRLIVAKTEDSCCSV